MANTSWQPWYVGQTFPAWLIPLNTDEGPDDISGFDISTFTLTFRSTAGIDRLGVGAFTVNTFSPAQVYYQVDPTDVAATFSGYLFIKAISDDGREVVYDPIGGTTPGSAFVITAS